MPVGSFLVAIEVIASTGFAAGALAFALDLVGLQLLNIAVRKFAAPELESRQAQREIMVRSSVEPRKIVYGEHVVSGPIAYVNVAGADNERLFHVIALTGHEIDSYVGFYIDSDYIPIADVDDVNGSPAGDGAVQSGDYGPINGTDIAYFRTYLGTASQAADGMMTSAFTDWTASHRLRGVAYFIARFDYIDGSEDVWSGGVDNLRARIKGKKVYDPRLDTSPGNDPTNASYIAWSDNPALCTADYLIDSDLGTGWDTSEIDWQSVVDAADYCDTLVDVPPAASPANTEKRYRCDVVLFSTEEPRDNIAKLLSSFNGRLTRGGGKWHIDAGYTAPTVTLTDDHLAGPIRFRSQPLAQDRYNTVRGVFVDRERNWKTSQFHEVTDATFQTRDGGKKLYRDIVLEGVTREYQAQRIAYNVLQQSANPGVCIFPANFYPVDLMVGDTVAVTVSELSWSSKVFRVQSWDLTETGGVELTLKEESSAAHADPAVTDYTTQTTAGGVVPPSYTPPAPVSLSATAVRDGIKLEWLYLPIGQSNVAGFRLYASADDQWANASEIAFTSSTNYLHILPPGRRRYYWVRAVTRSGVESDRNPDSDTSTVTARSFAPIGTELFHDPDIQQESDWSLGVGADWLSSGGFGGKSAIRVASGLTTSEVVSVAYDDEEEYPNWSPGLLRVQCRVKVTDSASPPFAAGTNIGIRLTVYEADGTFIATVDVTPERLINMQPADNGEWITVTDTVEITDADLSLSGGEVRPFRMKVGFGAFKPIALSAIFDQISIQYSDPPFDGGNANAQKLGLGKHPATSPSGKYLKDDGTWDTPSGTGSGEANTASNVGTDGVGVFSAKSGVDLEFHNVAPGSNKMTVTLNGEDIDIDVDESNFAVPAGRITSGTFADARVAQSNVTQHQGAIDHGSIAGLAGDDHTQYHNDARGDARYYTQTQLNAGQLDGRYYTESEVDSALAGKANSAHTHDHGTLTGLGDNDHPHYARKASIETINASWTIAATMRFNDAVEAEFGSSGDARIFWSNSQTELRVDAGTGAGADLVLVASSNGSVIIERAGVDEAQSQDSNAAGNTSGMQVKDHAQTMRDVGFNVLPVQTEDVSDTLEAKHCGGVYFKDGTGAVTLTLEASTGSDFPIGGVCTIINAGASADITVSEGSGTTLYVLEGSGGRTDSAGGCTVAPGSVATLWREAAGIYYIFGNGVTP